MTIQSTSVCVILLAVPWSITSLFVEKFDCLRYSCSGVAI